MINDAAKSKNGATLRSATPVASFRRDVLLGLSRQPKSLPCKYFYDAHGADLFDKITELAAYYPTRTELSIMRHHAREMSFLLGRRAWLVELGSGSSTKTRILLDNATDLEAYVPVDISLDYLGPAAESLGREYPGLAILPVCADYTRPFDLPLRVHGGRTTVYFPGSTIGNFQPSEARQFLKLVAGLCGPKGGLLIGVDLKKETALLDAAYNDEQGVTAAFNLNLLGRINREIGGDFDLAHFRHRAFYDVAAGRIEMQLVSTARQIAHVGAARFDFAEGEAISTEYSYKYTVDEFQRLAAAVGFVPSRVWCDEKRLFSVHYLTVGEIA
jgi:dimethylhistidine N-methyltransferase